MTFITPAEAGRRLEAMRAAVAEVESALKTLGKGSPWSADIKAGDDFLTPLFETYYGKLGLPNLMAKKKSGKSSTRSRASRNVRHLRKTGTEGERGVKPVPPELPDRCQGWTRA